MPVRLAPSSLFSLSSKMVASLLLTGCQTLDKEWVEPSQDEEEVVPFIKPTGREDVFLQLSPTHRTVLVDWLSNLPIRMLEEVVDLLAKVEK